jgi:putative transposase
MDEGGAFMVTAGTYQKVHHFGSAERLTLLENALLTLARDHQGKLQAWSVMSNHYHFVALATEEGCALRDMIRRLHAGTAVALNRLDGAPGRKVWYQYWDTRLTSQGAYYARLNYVHQNPAHHRLVANASNYRWCSALWFERAAAPAFYRTVTAAKTDRVNVYDEFDVVLP